jgi:hypothetical protein
MVTKVQQKKSLAIVAAWLGKKGMTEDGSPTPTGKEAAERAEGPQLIEKWDWPNASPDTIILEGGLHGWAIRASFELASAFKKIGVFAEPYAGYALCLYKDGE